MTLYFVRSWSEDSPDAKVVEQFDSEGEAAAAAEQHRRDGYFTETTAKVIAD